MYLAVLGRKMVFLSGIISKTLLKLILFASTLIGKNLSQRATKENTITGGDCREDIGYFIKGKEPLVFHRQYLREAGLSSASKRKFEQTGVGLACGNVWIDIPEAYFDGGLNRKMEHPDQKPLNLIKRIISASSNEGDLVLDPCAGSGTTGLACLETNRKCILIEKERKYYELSKKRIQKLPLN